MKRVAFLLLALCGSVGAAQPTGSFTCPVWDAGEALTDGLVNVREPLLGVLSGLVPNAGLRGPHVCWYQTAEGHLEGFPWDKGYDVGYEFAFADSTWSFVKRNEYVVLGHTRKH